MHINSGIPNKAFYLFATAGRQRLGAGRQVWYAALRASSPDTNFQAFAVATGQQARTLYGQDVCEAVTRAWDEVGIQI